MKNEKLYFISWIRAFSTICIVLCHLCSSSSIGWIIPFGQVFNIGVQIFFLISAFCFGYQGNIINVKEWYLKRLRRIICPYWIFLLIIYGVYFVTNQKISYINLLSCMFFLQGMHAGILGADHTWFMTTLIICYILTPIISKLWIKVIAKRKQKKAYIMILIMPIIMALVLKEAIFFIIYHIFFYSIAYGIGYQWKKLEYKIGNSKIYLFCILLLCCFRVLARTIFDGTKLYEWIIVNYVYYFTAGCIFILFVLYFSNIKPIKIVQKIDLISFEIYLYHYMFVVGPVSLMQITKNWIINSVVVICVTVLIAMILHEISKKVLQYVCGSIQL